MEDPAGHYTSRRMYRRPGSLGILALAALAYLAAPGDAHAYVDPGSGSLILQIVVGTIVGSLVAAKVYWHRAKSFFTRRPPAPPDRSDRTDT